MPTSRIEVIKKYQELEKEKKFDVHVDPVDYSLSLPVTKDFNYLHKGIFHKIKVFLDNLFIITPFTFYINKVVTKTRVFGKENLRGIKGGIVTCNHVYMFDCLVLKRALRPKKSYFTAASFNNRKDFLGKMMRSGGMLPIGDSVKSMRPFTNAVEHYLLYDNLVTFYPEQAMWYMYDKPRPFKNGAFHYAAKFDVPIVPCFITYRESNRLDKEGLPIKYFDLHIMKPIYPIKSQSLEDNVRYLKCLNYEMVKEKYEEYYHKKLVFEGDN